MFFTENETIIRLKCIKMKVIGLGAQMKMTSEHKK